MTHETPFNNKSKLSWTLLNRHAVHVGEGELSDYSPSTLGRASYSLVCRITKGLYLHSVISRDDLPVNMDVGIYIMWLKARLSMRIKGRVDITREFKAVLELPRPWGRS